MLILTSPLSDHAKVAASNQYALPVLTYLIWTQTWPIANIQQLDQVGKKIVVENGGKHPKGSTAILYMSRKLGGRGLKSVENEWMKNSKIKAAVKLYCIGDPTMAAVRSFEELPVQNDPLFKDLTLLKTCSISRHPAHSVRRGAAEMARWKSGGYALCGQNFQVCPYPQRKLSSTEFFSLVCRSCYKSSVHLPSRW